MGAGLVVWFLNMYGGVCDGSWELVGVSWAGCVCCAAVFSFIFGGGSEDDSVQEGLANHQKLMPKSKNKFAQFSNTRFMFFALYR
jgi:hypothetical protein